jgi:DNA-binding CsgD family transcriptional regulator
MTYVEGGIAYCIEHDMDLGLGTMQGERAWVRLDQGDWAGAEEDAGAVLSISGVSAANRVPALTVLGLVRTRRGDCSAQAVLDEARDLALATGAMQYIAPMAAARAEWRWLSGDPAGCVVEAEIGLQESPQIRFRWQQSELTLWLWRSDVLLEAPTDAPAPFAFEMVGDWCTAADTWERLGCPYEQALALLGGDEEAFRAALSIFERLGATPAAEIARRRLHECGARGLPRGPRPATRTNPQGLTRRQLEILPLLAGGLYNSEIAERLSTSPKTVEHHVSAVLAKLNARTRAEAVRRAYELGILSQMDSAPDTK